jgi:hypothetical protein
MISTAITNPVPPDLAAVFEFHDSHAGTRLGVSLATLLQCLCIAEQCHLVPPLEADWELKTLPPALRELSQVTTDEADPNSSQR